MRKNLTLFLSTLASIGIGTAIAVGQGTRCPTRLPYVATCKADPDTVSCKEQCYSVSPFNCCSYDTPPEDAGSVGYCGAHESPCTSPYGCGTVNSAYSRGAASHVCAPATSPNEPDCNQDCQSYCIVSYYFATDVPDCDTSTFVCGIPSRIPNACKPSPMQPIEP